jgi:cytochrome P450
MDGTVIRGEDTSMTALPPGPRTPSILQWLEYGFFPNSLFTRAQRRFGDTFTVRIIGEEFVILADPADIKEVFTGDPDLLYSGEANEALRSIIGRRNVLLLDGPEHLRRRRLVLPPFHGERLAAYEEVIVEETRRELGRWPAGRAMPVAAPMRAITFEVILRTVFGVDDAGRLDRLRRALTDLLSWTARPAQGIIFGLLGPDRLERMPRYRREIATVDAELFAHIRERRADPALEERDDILSMLLLARDTNAGAARPAGTGEDGAPLDDLDIRDELVTLLAAGHETTAALLAWAIHEVVRTPGALDRLAAREEGWADAVVRETLRLHPPLPVVVRRLKAPMTIGGRELPEGATVGPCALLVHQREDLYPEPRAFRPERFLGTAPSTYGWLPFGGGVRRCIGAAFAQLEARIVLEELAAAFELRPDRPRRERTGRRGIVLVPARGARVVVTGRRAGAAEAAPTRQPAAAA